MLRQYPYRQRPSSVASSSSPNVRYHDMCVHYSCMHAACLFLLPLIIVYIHTSREGHSGRLPVKFVTGGSKAKSWG